ncbi:pyridoxamine 5'-phosphate oxidase [Mesonia ostreae]|uniref:Pyridoxine/pyridoxamine 5'-phosphate oxidase n=1 Tax=Mesonia ostreae TaxID=861110 RepID=A0ABU2KKA5_9FLAO|nr:pyridoxamine 5'-phosphate oxidase [Mesonia ostreae]MDT0295155.1 pyridoxamine 5'-phosphate oxidase [Mesonia ostreae]
MEKDLQNYRKSYEKSELNSGQLQADPLILFKEWFTEVEKAQLVEEVNAMSLSTVGEDGFPKTRIVLLKKFSEDGFIFYTNYKSEKGLAIEKHPKVCLSFFWPAAERQVIIKGTVGKVSSEESDAYFSSRPRGSQMGAMVSPQSNPIPDREFLEKKLEELQQEDGDFKRPETWGGYLVKPQEMEFWQGRANRLHDRFVYQREDSNQDWKILRLAP